MAGQESNDICTTHRARGRESGGCCGIHMACGGDGFNWALTAIKRKRSDSRA
jgi:hypothetical protein